MPKANPKHNKVHVARKANWYPAPTLSMKAPTYYDMVGGLRSAAAPPPKLPSDAKMRQIQRQYHPILFEMESHILQWHHTQPGLDNYSILDVLAALLSPSEKSRVIYENLDASEKDLHRELTRLLVMIKQEYAGNSRSIFQDCAGCLYKSAQLWIHEGGNTGYTDYIENFIPVDLSSEEIRLVKRQMALDKSAGIEWDEEEDLEDLDANDFDWDPEDEFF